MNNVLTKLKNVDIIITDLLTRKELYRYKSFDPLLKFKVFTKEEIKKRLLGETSFSLIPRIIKDFNFTYPLAKEYANNLLFLSPSTQNEKLQTIEKIYFKYNKEHLFGEDLLFPIAEKNKNVVILGALSFDHELVKLLHTFTNNITFLTPDTSKKHTVDVYSYEFFEVLDVLNKISALLDKGVSYQNIYVLTPPQNIKKLIYTFAPHFNLVFEQEKKSLYSFPYVLDFITKVLMQKVTLNEEIINNFIEESSPLLKPYLARVFAEYPLNALPSLSYLSLLQEVLKTTFVNNVNEGIKFVDTLPLFSLNDDHYFVLDFSKNSVPTIKADRDFLLKEEKKALGALLIEEENVINYAQTKISLNNLTNVHLSFSVQNNGEKQHLSSLFNELKMEKKTASIPATFYSKYYAKFYYGYLRDNYEQYGLTNDEFVTLDKYLPFTQDYNSYSHAFKGINFDHKSITLSYTDLDLYHRLPFDYFVSKLLRINDDQKTFALKYGTFIHEIMEKTKDLNLFELHFAHGLKDDEFTKRELAYVLSEKDLIYSALAFREQYKNEAKVVSDSREVKFSLSFGPHIFKGKVDQIFTYENAENKYIVVIDYKTGSTFKNEPDLYIHGLNLQLPIYAYFLANDKRYQDHHVSGLFIQPIMFKNNAIKEKFQEDNKAYYPLLGYEGLVTQDKSGLLTIDPTAADSQYIKKLKFVVGGEKFPPFSFSEETFNNILSTVDKIIHETFNLISNNVFPITFKRLPPRGRVSSHEFSSYRDISYVDSRDGINLFAGKVEDEEEDE